jgi:hypothetical protein
MQIHHGNSNSGYMPEGVKNMEQELNAAQQDNLPQLDPVPQAPPVKRGRGRPRKPDSELSAKTLAARKAEAEEISRAHRGRALDEYFKAEMERLRAELSSYSTNGGYDSERHHAETFIDQGYRLLRSIGYDLKSIQMLEIEQIEEIWEAEFGLPSDQQTHMPMFVDASANEMVWHCRQAHLTPALARFEIKVLEAVLQWGSENPENFEHRSVLEIELEARRCGEDTFQPANKLKKLLKEKGELDV